MGRAVTLKNGMTPKQSRFTKIIVKQLKEKGEFNATDAAMIAYDVKNRAVAGAVAGENLQKPIVKRTIEDALNSAGLSTDHLVSEMGKIANSEPEKWTADTKLKALTTLLKLQGAFGDSPKGKGTIKHKLESITWDEAKQQLTKLTQEQTTFITEAEVE